MKRQTIKGLKLADMPLAIVNVGREWRPVVGERRPHPNDPDIGLLGRMDDLKPAQRRKVQAWIDWLQPARG